MGQRNGAVIMSDDQKIGSDRIVRGIALVKLANDVGAIMSQARAALDDSKKLPGGPLPEGTQSLLVELERLANAAAYALCKYPEARY